MNNKSVFGIAKNLSQAEQIVTQLQEAGFSLNAISILYSDIKSGNLGQPGVRQDRGSDIYETTSKRTTGGLGHEKHTKAPEGAATGGTAGGIIGGTLGLLAGLGALAIPGMGAFIAAGPIMAALAGSAVGGSIGLLTGALVGLGIPEYEAVHYAERLKNRENILISVHTISSEQVDLVKNIFERNGAEDIASTAETTVSGKRNR